MEGAQKFIKLFLVDNLKSVFHGKCSCLNGNLSWKLSLSELHKADNGIIDGLLFFSVKHIHSRHELVHRFISLYHQYLIVILSPVFSHDGIVISLSDY